MKKAISFRALLATACLLALAVAQNIAFTSLLSEVVAQETYNITWGGGDGTGVALTLRRGTTSDLQTVDTIADVVTNVNYYLWTVSKDLESGDDYILQITQGQSAINYSGFFSVASSSSNNTTPQTISATSSSTIASSGSASSSISTSTSNLPSVSTIASPAASANDRTESGGLSTGAKAGIGIAVPIGLLLIATPWLLLFLKHRRDKHNTSQIHSKDPTQESTGVFEKFEKDGAQVGSRQELHDAPTTRQELHGAPTIRYELHENQLPRELGTDK